MGDWLMDDVLGINPPPKPKAAATPDPAAAAQQQYQYNKQATIDSSMYGNIDQYGPYGQTVFARRPDGSVYAQTVTLDPKVRANVDSQLAAGAGLNNAALKQIGFLPQDKFQLPNSPNAQQYAANAFGERALDYNSFADPLSMGMYEATAVAPGSTEQIGYNPTMQQYNSPYQAVGPGNTEQIGYDTTPQSYQRGFQQQNYDGQVQQQQYQNQGYDSRFQQQQLAPTASTQDIAQTSYDRAKSMFEPDLQAQRKQLEIQLANRGIPVGSSVYNDEMGRLDRQANNMYEQASRQAILDSGAEQSRQFGQNLQAGQFGAQENQRGMSDAQFAAQFGMSDAQFKAQFGSGEDARNLANQQFAAQFGSAENQRGMAENQFASQFGQTEDQRGFQNAFDAAGYYDQSDLARRALMASENQRGVGDAQFGSTFGQGEDARMFNQNLQAAQYYNSDDLARRNFMAGEDSRLAGNHLSNQQFLGSTQNQQYNQMVGALGYGNNAYQQNLSNQLLERNQPFAEAAALLGTTPQFQTPQFMNTQALNVASPDYLGVVNQNSRNAAQIQSAQMAADAQKSSGMWNAIGGIGAAVLSDENKKEDRRPADGESILFSIRDLPVDDYRYKDSAQAEYGVPEHRTGPMAQDWSERFGGDEKSIDLGDAFGKLLAAVQALDARTAGQSPKRGRAA